MKQQEVSGSTLSYVNLIVGSMLVLEFTDQLKGTAVFRQGVKYHGKGLISELEKLISGDSAKLYRQDETMMVNLSRNMESLVRRLAVLRPDELVLVSQLIDKFFEDKEGFSQRNPVMFQNLADG